MFRMEVDLRGHCPNPVNLPRGNSEASKRDQRQRERVQDWATKDAYRTRMTGGSRAQ